MGSETTAFDSLAAVCSEDIARASISSPYETLLWGRRWAVATNGHAFAALVMADDAPPMRQGGPALAGILPAAFSPTHTADLAALREWAGTPNKEPCETCDGNGETDNLDCPCPNCVVPHQCTDCDGNGVEYAVRPANLLGVGINCSLVARVLRSAPAEGRVEIVGPAGTTPGAPMLFRAGDWLAGVAPLGRSVAITGPAFTATAPVARGTALGGEG